MVLLGNVLAFLGGALMMLIGLIKTKNKILAAQMVQFTLQGSGYLALGSMSGVLCNIVGVIRIIVFQRCKVTVWLKLGFIALQAVLMVVFDPVSLVSFFAWLPMIATVVYVWNLDTPNVVRFKLANITCNVIWAVFDLHYMNYAALAFDIITMATTTVGIAMLLQDRKKENSK